VSCPRASRAARAKEGGKEGKNELTSGVRGERLAGVIAGLASSVIHGDSLASV